MSSSKNEFFVVFDTNILFQNYDQKADFNNFTFNATFRNVLDMVNQLDIYEQVTIAIPEVTWNEMKKQIIEAHDKKILDLETTLRKWKFPEYNIIKNETIDYSAFISKSICDYQKEIEKGINAIITLPVPSNERFKGIIKRAFDKAPPFVGKEKNSDKGFKDVLIWESILEFVLSHKQANIIFYTKDNGFKEVLIKEFQEMNPDAVITILFSEEDVKNTLEEWAKKIDIYKYQPIEPYIENRDIIEWLESADFEVQMIDRDYSLVEKNRLITSTCLKLINYDNINVINEYENSVDYSVDVTLEVSYTFKGGGSIREVIDVTVHIECVLGVLYSVVDAYRTDVEDTTDDSEEEEDLH